jgi:hypothetical protein
MELQLLKLAVQNPPFSVLYLGGPESLVSDLGGLVQSKCNISLPIQCT